MIKFIFFSSYESIILNVFCTSLLCNLTLNIIKVILYFIRWKYYEVILLCIGYVQQSVLEKVESGEIKDDFKNSLKEMLITACSPDSGLYI